MIITIVGSVQGGLIGNHERLLEKLKITNYI